MIYDRVPKQSNATQYDTHTLTHTRTYMSFALFIILSVRSFFFFSFVLIQMHFI